MTVIEDNRVNGKAIVLAVTSPSGFYRLPHCCVGRSRLSQVELTLAELTGVETLQTLQASFMTPPDFSVWAKRRDRRKMHEGTDDRLLMSRIADADEAAMKVLFTRYQARVFGFIRRIMRNDAVAEELTNEVFLEVWRGARNFQGRSSVTTWLLSIAHHRSLNVLRKRREQGWNEEAASQMPDLRDDPEVAVQKADKGAVLRDCSNALSPIDREIIDLVYFHEMSIREAGEVLNVPEGTVKARLFKARKRLAALLDAAGVDRGWP